MQGGLVKGTFPSKGLRFPKDAEKEPFRTFAEIEALVAAGADDGRKDALWEALYLTRPEVEELLAHVKRRFSPMADRKGLYLRLVEGGTQLRCRTDPSKLERVRPTRALCVLCVFA